MAEVIKRGEFSQLPYRFTIAGDEPTVDEQMRIDQILRTEEFKFAKDYEEKYGRQLSGEGEGVLNYLGEFPKGVASGVIGGLESAALFATPYLPESVFGVPVRDPYREGVRSLAYGAKPLPDVGMEDTVSGKFGQALGSFVPLLATAVATKNPAAVSALSAAMGGGEATERAIAGGATVEQQRAAGILGAGVGAIGAISPLRLSKAIGEPVTLAIIDRVRRAALEGGLEGATEVAETIAQNLIEQGIYNPEQGTFTETGEAFGYGAGVGAFVKGILDLAVPGKAPAAPSAVAPAAAPSAVAPAAPAEPKPTKPGVATISSVMRQGPRFGPATTTTVRLSDGEKITLKGDATEADIARAVDQYNKTKAAAEAPAAPKAPTPKTKVEDIPEAEIVQEAPRAAGGVSVDEDLAEARAVYDERLAIAEEGGADPEEAKRVAAQAAVNYVDSLPEDTRKRLERFRNTMARWATPTRGVMPPDLPDEAYSQEFGEPVQQDLFAAEPTAPTPAPAPEVVPAAVAPTPEVPPAPAPELTLVPEVEAPKVDAPKAEAPKPAQVLTEETVDRLGIGKAKSARLRKLVGKPLTDTKVVQALSSWAQNDRATPENKALAVRLITGQPEPEITPAPEVQDDTTTAAPEPETVGAGVQGIGRGVEQRGGIGSDIQPTEGVEAPAGGGLGGGLSVPVGADAAARAEPDTLAQLEEKLAAARARAAELRKQVPAEVLQRELVGGKIDPRLPKQVANLQNVLSQQRAAAESAKAKFDRTKVPGATRDGRLRAYEAALAKVNETQTQLAAVQDQLAAAELSAGLRRAAEPKAPMTNKAQSAYTAYFNALQDADILRQTLESERARRTAAPEGPAPLPTDLREPVIPDTFMTYQRGITSKPVRPSKAPTAVAEDIRKRRVFERLSQFFKQRASEALLRYTTARGGINSETTWKDYPDWMSVDDQMKVVQLLGRLNRKEREKYKLTAAEAEPLSRDAEAAHTYFSKTIRPVDAIAMMLDDLSADYEIYEGSLRPGRTEIEHRDLMAGTGSEVATRALNWVRANLSPETNAEIDLILKKQAEKDVITADWIGVEGTDRVAKGRALRKEAREARAKAAEESGYDAASIIRKMAADDSRVALDQEMHYSVKAALNAGDLMGALRALADTTSNRELKDMASRFAGLVGTTRVRVLYPGDSAKYIGRDRGVFVQQRGANIDPDYENIILINGQTGMTNHVLMHEVAHALSARFIDENPNHPVVRQLQDLLTELRSVGPKQELYATGRGTARVAYPTNFYGLTDISELVAEGYGRLAFGEVDNGLRDLMKRTTLRQPVDEQVEIENPLNAWERFKEIIGNILNAIMRKPLTRRPRTKRIETVQRYETAAERFHRLVDGLLSEAPQVLPASVVQAAVIKPMIAKNLLDNAVLSGSTWSPAGRKRLADLMSAAVPEPLKRALLQLLQLEWFNDLAGKYFSQIAELKKLDDMRRGQWQRMVQEAQAVFDDLRDYAKKFPELFKTMSSLWGQATRAGVDPTEPQSKYAGDKEKSDTWLNFNRQMTQADSSGQMRGLFRKVRNLKRFYRAEIERVLRVKAEEITGDKGKADTLVRMLMRKLDEENAIDPYFSLMRTGDFWLEYTAQDTTGAPVGVDLLGNELRHTERFVQAFKSPLDLSNLRAKLEAKTDANGNPIAWSFEEKIKPTVDRGRAGYIPPEFVQAGMNIINSFDRPDATGDEKAKIEAAKTAIEDLFLRLTPDHSFLKSFIKRKGTRGFVGDVTPLGVIDAPLDILTTLSEKTSAMSYQLTNMEFGARIQKLINSASVTEKNLQESPQLTLGEKAAVRVYYAEFVDRAKFAKSPHVRKLSQATRGVTFGMTLGFNLAGALSNLATLPIIAVPEIAGRYGTSGALRELGFAMRTLANAGKTQKVLSFGAEDREVRAMSSVDNVGSLANYFEPGEDGNLVLRTDKKIPEALRDKIANMDVLAEVMANNGMLSASTSQEMLEAESGWLHKINRWSGFAMHHAERFNRQSVAVAVYNLELGNVKGTATRAQKLAAAMKAVETTDKVNGSIGAATAPPISQGPIGSVLFMYKRFGLHTTRYIINVALQSLKKIEPGMSEAEIVEAKKERAVARYQITGILGATALLAGVQGLPFFSELMSLLDLFFTDDDEEPPEVLVQKFLGEPYYHGALNYLLGIEVASRISMSGLIFRENKIEKDQSVYYDLIEMFGGPAVGVALNVERGYNLLAEGQVYRGVEALMPSAIKSAMKAGRYAVEDATTLRGDEVVELSAMDVLRQAIGYTPNAYARAQERASAAKRVDEAVDSKRRKLLKKYNIALRLGDFAEVREILKEMVAFTRKHPDAAIIPDTLKRSATSFRQRSQEMISGTSFRDVPRAQRYIDDFDEDISFWGS